MIWLGLFYGLWLAVEAELGWLKHEVGDRHVSSSLTVQSALATLHPNSPRVLDALRAAADDQAASSAVWTETFREMVVRLASVTASHAEITEGLERQIGLYPFAVDQLVFGTAGHGVRPDDAVASYGQGAGWAFHDGPAGLHAAAWALYRATS